MSEPTADQHRAALVHELAFWRQQVPRPEFTGQHETNWRTTAAHFESALSVYVRRPARAVLQVGVAVRDAINFMARGPLRVAVDPLADAYGAELSCLHWAHFTSRRWARRCPFRPNALTG